MDRRQLLRFAAVAVVTLALAACGEERSGEVATSPLGANDATDYEYVVPYGTGNKLDAGEVIEIMPQTLDVKVGESIRIVNDDIRDYMIGPFFVTAGQTLAMRFTHPGVLTGICLVNPGGEFTINVAE
ncbi:MAG: twin-arginine translocation signal domain-containing protein [Ilumatobacteraceae bacterium]